MARNQPIQTNFTAGELSPRMKGRVDVARYANGVAQLENFIIMPQGGAYRRSGTRFVGEIRDSSKKPRLIRFEFSTTQAYVLQFEDQKIRFLKDEGQIVLTAQNISGITKANPAVVTYVGSDTYANGDRVIIDGVVGMTEVNNREFTVANVNTGANTFELSGINSTSYTTYVSGGTIEEIYEINSTYLEAELFQIQYTQSADVLYLTQQAHAPAKLSRTAHTSWTLSDITFIDGPYMSERSDITITPSGTTGSVTLTASASLFAATDVGRQIRILHSSSWSYATITAFTNATTVTATVGSQATVASASSKFRLGAFYTGNYPQSVVFHEQRLIFGGTPAEPQTFWASKSGEYETFSPTTLGTTTVTDSSGFSATIVSNRVNVIRWMVSGAVLSIGTTGGEWQVKAGTINEAITPTNFGITEQSAWGSKLIQAAKVGSAILFIDRSGRKVREYQYNFQVDSFIAKDLSLLSEHLLREGDYITDLAYQQAPDSVAWMVRADGVLVGMTYISEQDIVGFHRHVFGGVFGSGDPVVESIAVIPNPEGTSDQLWLVIKRTINGTTKRYIEFLEDPFLPDDPNDKDSMFFVDCGLTYSGSATTAISGLTHLAGQTVAVCGDASVRPDESVSTVGKITLDSSASLAQIGLPYVSTIHTLPPEGGNPFGSAQGKQKRVHQVDVRILDSLTLQYSANGEEYDTLAFRATSDPMDSSPPLFTGDKPLELDSDIESEGDYFIRQTNPYPLTVLALMPKMVVTET